MAQTAELRAGNLVLEFGIPRPGPHLRGRDGGDEPDGDRQAGDGVLLHAKLGHAEAVDDVLAPEPHDDRLVHGQIELIDSRDVVLRGRIGAIESQRVRLEVEQLDVRAAEYPVGAGIVDVPGELLAGHLNDQRFVVRGHVVDPRGPQRDRESDQENRFDHGHADLEIGRPVRRDPLVVRHRIPRLPETDEAVEEEPSPARRTG